MNFLLTNDDGIDAPGLQALESAVGLICGGEYECVVAAPYRGFSGCGHLVNYTPIQVDNVAPGRFRVHAAPADCARLGLLEIAPETTCVLSGINEGGNLGVDIWMSGTVAAVREAGWLKTPGIAISQYCRRERERDWEKSARMAALVLEKLLSEPLGNFFYNVNLPDVDTKAESLEIAETFVEPQHIPISYRQEDDGSFHYTGDYRGRPRTPGSDVDICFGGNISVTKIAWPGCI